MFEPIEIHSINNGHNLLSLFSGWLMWPILSLTLLKYIGKSSEKSGILKGSYPSSLLVLRVWGRANEALPNFIRLFIWVYLTPESDVKNIYLNTTSSIIEIQYSRVVSHTQLSIVVYVALLLFNWMFVKYVHVIEIHLNF